MGSKGISIFSFFPTDKLSFFAWPAPSSKTATAGFVGRYRGHRLSFRVQIGAVC